MYVTARANVAKMIAREFTPDYLFLGNEPDMEALATGYPFRDLNTVLWVYNYIIQQVRTVNATVQLGAGIGTWQPDHYAWAIGFSQLPLQMVDFHIYPPNKDLLTRIFELADIVRMHGKEPSVGQCWMYKVSDAELMNPHPSDYMIRDVWDFWSEQDSRFIKAMVGVAHHKRLKIMSVWWSRYFWEYLSYPETFSMTNEQLLAHSIGDSTTALLTGRRTATADAYEAALS